MSGLQYTDLLYQHFHHLNLHPDQNFASKISQFLQPELAGVSFSGFTFKIRRRSGSDPQSGYLALAAFQSFFKACSLNSKPCALSHSGNPSSAVPMLSS